MEEIQNESLPPQVSIADPHAAKKAFSRIGFGILIMLGVSVLVQLLFEVLFSIFFPDLMYHPWGNWLVTFVPLYLIGIPASYLFLRTLPATILPRISMKFSHLLLVVLISVCMMYTGNLAGILVTNLVQQIFSLPASNPVESFTAQTEVLPRIVFVVLLGPVLEELAFRKFLIDRMANYGEFLAVLVSSLIFGLFHGNFSQLFYAFALGMVFGYIYLRTGKLRYSIFLHCFINFFGGVIGPELIEQIPPELLEGTNIEALVNLDTLAALAALSGYSLTMMAAALAGLVILCVNRKKIIWKPAPLELPKAQQYKIAFVNFGMIALGLTCLGLIIFSLF